jgi:hypothetical protein
MMAGDINTPFAIHSFVVYCAVTRAEKEGFSCVFTFVQAWL